MLLFFFSNFPSLTVQPICAFIPLDAVHMAQQEEVDIGVAEHKLLEWLKNHSKECTEEQVVHLRDCIHTEMKDASVDQPIAIWLVIRALVCFQISLKLFHTAEARLSDVCEKLKECDVHINFDVFRKLVVSNERKIVNDCGFRFLYYTSDVNGNEDHLHHVLGKSFEDNFEQFVEIAYNAMPLDHPSIRVCMRRQWQVVQMLCTWYTVPPCIALHAMLTTVLAWFTMDVWQINQ